MEIIRKPEEAEGCLNSLKIGEEATFAYNPRWRVTRVVGGHIYSSDYAGSCFVPFAPQTFSQAIEEPKETKRGGKLPKVVTK